MLRHRFSGIQHVKSITRSDVHAWLDPSPEPEEEGTPLVSAPPPPSTSPHMQQRSYSSPITTTATSARLPPPSPVRAIETQAESTPYGYGHVAAAQGPLRGTPSHFVKHSSKATVLLSGQEEGVSVPEYATGDTIDGILAVPRPSGLISLEVTVEGTMKLTEAAGNGSFESDILKDSLFSWSADRHPSFPAKATFRYVLPTHYTHRPSGERHRLPPTYDAHLSGLPGFTVEISYAEMQGASTVPDCEYRESSRPSMPGPFPSSIRRGPSGPKTLFRQTLQSRRGNRENIDVQLFLPASQVCTFKESIPFYVTLFAGEDALEPFTSFRPNHASFHPLSSPSSSSSSLGHQLMHIAGQTGTLAGPSAPVVVQLQRRTQVDAMAAGMPTVAAEKSHMSAIKTLARAVFHATTRHPNSITWQGSIVVPTWVRSGGFVANGIKVTDHFTLSIVSPDQSAYVPFSESVPLLLTTEAYDCYAAPVAISEWQ